MIYLIDEFVLFLLNPFGMLIVVASLLYAEKTIVKNLKDSGGYGHAVHVKIREID